MNGKVMPLRSRQDARVAERERIRSFTSWKFDILDAMASDPRVPHRIFRIAFRIMQAVNSKTPALSGPGDAP
jgi:hypothetical protein